MKGAWGERAARAFLEQRGYRTEATNFRTRFGEIDMIARDGKYIVSVSYTHLDVYKRQLVYPKPDAAEDMLYDRGVFQVELDQLIVPLPALVPETVVIARIAIE